MMQERLGLVAILDALGAGNYSKEKIERFLESRNLVIGLLKDKVRRTLSDRVDIDADLVTTFTFNDTVLIVYTTDRPPASTDVEQFCKLLRMFTVKSLEHGILFRGAFASGSFYMDRGTSTVMGDAVRDAAAWYDQTDWMGITATPHATLLIHSLADQSKLDLTHLIVNYPVPLKDRTSRPLMVVNWPMAFFVRGVRPERCADREKPRVVCLSLLADHGVPKGTELKYFNTVAFFDYCAAAWEEERKARSTLTGQRAPAHKNRT